ncbi:MAG: hypothetical protein AB2417_15790 [Clostridiaceae bacterium]
MFFNVKRSDPIRLHIRKGTVDDPYVDITEKLTVINNNIQLHEIPSEFERVVIDGYTEIMLDKYEETFDIEPNKFLVDYQTGMIKFNESEEKKDVTATYKGTGVIKYPASRIWVHSPNPWAVENLQEFIDFIYKKEQELKNEVNNAIEFIKNKTQEYMKFIQDKTKEFVTFLENKKQEFIDFVQLKTDEFVAYVDKFIERAEEKIKDMDIHIEISKKQTEECREATEEAKKATEETLEAKQATEETMEKAIEATNKANEATKWSIEKTQESIEATNKAIEETQLMKIDRFNTRLIWQEPVDVFASIDIVYPKSEMGWTVMTLDNGNIYRWDGFEWKYIGNMKGGIPLVNENSDGLMHKEDYIKLLGIEEKAQRNFIGEDAKNALPDYVHTKTIVFVIAAKKLKEGVQDVQIEFEEKGIIQSVSGICKTPGIEYTAIQLEKISDADMKAGNDNWVEVCETNKEVIFDYGEYKSTQARIVAREVNPLDSFRLNIKKLGGRIESITIKVRILV